MDSDDKEEDEDAAADAASADDDAFGFGSFFLAGTFGLGFLLDAVATAVDTDDADADADDVDVGRVGGGAGRFIAEGGADANVTAGAAGAAGFCDKDMDDDGAVASADDD